MLRKGPCFELHEVKQLNISTINNYLSDLRLNLFLKGWHVIVMQHLNL